MVENILQEILDTEKKAAAMLAEAQSEASEAIKIAQTQSREEERRAAVDHRELFRTIVAAKEREVQARLKSDAVPRKQQIYAAMRAAESRLAAAADMIVQEVLADGHR